MKLFYCRFLSYLLMFYSWVKYWEKSERKEIPSPDIPIYFKGALKYLNENYGIQYWLILSASRNHLPLMHSTIKTFQNDLRPLDRCQKMQQEFRLP